MDGISDFRRALRDCRHGYGRVDLALRSTRSIAPPGLQVDEFTSDKPHLSKGAGSCVIEWAFGGLARFLLLNMVTLAFCLPTLLGSRSKLLGAR